MTFESVDYGDEDEVRQTRAQLAEALAQRDEWHRQNGLTRGERDQWRRRAENAERELAELRELAGNPTYQWASSAPGFFFGPPLLDEAHVRRVVSEINAGGGHAVLKRRLVGEWTEVDGA